MVSFGLHHCYLQFITSNLQHTSPSIFFVLALSNVWCFVCLSQSHLPNKISVISMVPLAFFCLLSFVQPIQYGVSSFFFIHFSYKNSYDELECWILSILGSFAFSLSLSVSVMMPVRCCCCCFFSCTRSFLYRSCCLVMIFHCTAPTKMLIVIQQSLYSFSHIYAIFNDAPDWP